MLAAFYSIFVLHHILLPVIQPPDLLLKTGLAYKDFYSSNAYSYYLYRIPALAFEAALGVGVNARPNGFIH